MPTLTVTAFNAIQQVWVRTITLSGVPVLGDTWSFQIGANTASYTVVAEDLAGSSAEALTRIAAKLAAFVNDPDDAPVFDGYSAVASGARLFVTSTVGAFTATPAAGADGTYTVSAVAQSTRSVLTGSVVAGDTWTVGLLDTATGTLSSFTYVAASGNALAQVAAGLAGAINAGASPNFLAIAEGGSLVVINQAGLAFSTRLDVAPASAASVSRSFDVQGPVAAGNFWIVTLTAGGVATQVTATVTTDLVGLAGSLASAIDATADYRASATGTTLMISTEGASAGKAFVLSSSSPSGSIIEKAATTRREMVLFGPAVIGDVWTVFVTAGGLTSSVSVAVVADANPLAKLAENLAGQINALTGFATLYTPGGSAFFVDTAGGNFGKNVSVGYSVKRVPNAPSAAAAAATLGVARGVPVTGEVWRVTVAGPGGGTFNHTVTAGQTLAQVVAALAQQIVNTTGLEAAARGETIAVLDMSSALGSASFSIPTTVNGAGTPAALDGGSVLIGGAPKAGETVTVNLGLLTPLGAPVLYTHMVRETVPLAEIATGLAALINAAGLGYTASVDGNALVVTNLNAPPGGFSSSFVIDPAPTFTTAGIAGKTVQSATTTRFALGGSSRIGEAWKVTVAGQTYIYTVESKDVIAAKLAAAISATTDAGGAAIYAATAEGANLVVVRLAGTFPGFTAAVAARNSLTGNDASVATISPTATPVEGETWRVTIGTDLYTHVVQKVGAAVQTTADIASALAAKVNTGVVAGYTAFTDGDVLVIARADNAAIAATTFEVTPAASIVIDAGDADQPHRQSRRAGHPDRRRDLVRAAVDEWRRFRLRRHRGLRRYRHRHAARNRHRARASHQ